MSSQQSVFLIPKARELCDRADVKTFVCVSTSTEVFVYIAHQVCKTLSFSGVGTICTIDSFQCYNRLTFLSVSCPDPPLSKRAPSLHHPVSSYLGLNLRTLSARSAPFLPQELPLQFHSPASATDAQWLPNQNLCRALYNAPLHRMKSQDYNLFS